MGRLILNFLSILVVFVAVWSQLRTWPAAERAIPLLEPPFLWGYTKTDIPDLTGQVALVTGANSGLGLATTRTLLQNGATVIMGCRNMDKCNAARDSLSGSVPNLQRAFPMNVDLESLSSVATFVDKVAQNFYSLDMLILNAAIFPASCSFADETGLDLAFSVNHLAHVLLTNRILKRYKVGSNNNANVSKAKLKIAVVSSSHHYFAVDQDFHENSFKSCDNYTGNAAYGYSKLANILFAQELSERLTQHGVFDVYVNSVHPGGVATGILQDYQKILEKRVGIPMAWSHGFFKFIQGFGVFSPEDAALTVLYPVTSPDIEKQNVRGKYFVPVAKVGKRSHMAADQDLQKRLWTFTESILKKHGYLSSDVLSSNSK